MKKALNLMLLTILIISMFSALLGLVTPAYSAIVGTLEVSTTRFWGNAIVQVRLYDPDLNINVSKRDVATLRVTINSYNGSTYGPVAVYANESLPNSGEFYFYFANASATIDSTTVRNPPYGNSYYNITWGLKQFDQVVITYNDQSPVGSISLTVTYMPYVATAADISFDRTSLEYPMNGFIRIYVKDLDHNCDPTAADSVNLNITLNNPVSSNVTQLILNFTETGVNTGIFAMNTSVSYYTSSNFKDYTLNLTQLLSVTSPIKVIYGNETLPPFKYITFKTFPVTLDVAPTFTTSGDLLITVTDPNLEHKSWSIENLGLIGNTKVNITMGKDIVIVTTTLIETGVATATFKATVPVKIGTVNTADGILQYNLTSKVASIAYFANGTKVAETVSTLSTTPATLTTDKAMYKTTDIVILNLTAPDLNDDSLNINYFTAPLPSNNATISNIPVQFSGVTVGWLTIKVNGLLARSNATQTLTFVESGADTGVFTATLTLKGKILNNANQTLKNGDSVQIIYSDSINIALTSATFTIGVAAATIDIDRTTYPVPKEGDIKIYITVTSSEDNTSPTTIQTKPAYVDVYYYNGTRKASVSVTLTETGPNTGIFTGYYTLVQNSSQYLINGWIAARTINPATGLNVSKTATLTATDASISVSKTSVKAGDTLTITVTDPDKNFNSKAVESVTVAYQYTNTTGGTKTGSWTLYESGMNTATFTRTITIGSDIKVKPGTTIRLTYMDYTPSYITASSGYPTTPVTYTATAQVASHTGTLTTDKTEYGLGSWMIVTVNDPDLNTDITANESVTVTLRVAGLPDVTITLDEANVSSSVFTGSYPWGTDSTLIGKAFQVYYFDAADAAGNPAYAIVSGTIKSWDAVVAFEKSYYNVGEIATITVTDPDRNLNPLQIETFSVTVSSTSDPLGQTITAVETGVNTGVFTARIQISSTYETGKVYARVGDTLTASYRDDYPADYATTGLPKTFTGTALVGVPVERPVPASDQKFVDPNTGAEKTSGKVGEAIMLQATVTNVDAVSKSFTAIFKVKDSAGVTIFISWVTGTLAPGQSLSPAVSWTPSEAGTYTIEVLVVKSIAEPTPYSDKISTDLTVVA